MNGDSRRRGNGHVSHDVRTGFGSADAGVDVARPRDGTGKFIRLWHMRVAGEADGMSVNTVWGSEHATS